MGKTNYWWLLALLYCATPCIADQRIIIIGDSISEHIYCWPNELRSENPHLNAQLMTQSGRTIRDFSIPRDLRNVSGNDVVIYFLGTNDAFSGYPMRYVRESFASHMIFLQERGFRVIVLVPPPASVLMPKIAHVRDIIIQQSVRLHVEHHELAFWDETMTNDGIHPTPELSRLVSDFVYQLLEAGGHLGYFEFDSECSPDSTIYAHGQ